MNSTTTTNAILLVIAGFLGVITSHVSGAPLFGLAGLVAFLFAAAIGVGSFIRALKDGYNTSDRGPSREDRDRDAAKKRAAEYAERAHQRAASRAAAEPVKRTYRPYPSP